MSYSFKTVCSNLVPVGTYKAQVTDIKFAAGGSKNVLVTLTIAEGAYAKRTQIETIGEKAYSFRLMPLLKACKVDVDREFATAEELFKFGFSAAKGKFLTITMGTRTYNGTEYNTVTDFAPLADSTVSADEVTASFGENPQVNAAPVLDGNVDEEIIIPEDVPAANEPSLDINTDDIESPF